MKSALSPPLLVIVGPTASGKSDCAMRLAERLHGEIVSADAFLVYKGMDIGTAKPSVSDRDAITHHFIDIVSPCESYTVFDFVRDATAVIHAITQRGNIPIVCGGTYYYMDALLNGHYIGPPASRPLRDALALLVSEKGSHYLHARLMELDAQAAQALHPHNIKRVIRAIEVCLLSGQAHSHMPHCDGIVAAYRTIKIGLAWDKNILAGRIEQRVETMIKNGLWEEVQCLMARYGLGAQHPAAAAIGYREMLHYVAVGEPPPFSVVKTEIAQHTRHLAKKQLTWLRKDSKINWLSVVDEKHIIEQAIERLQHVVPDIIPKN